MARRWQVLLVTAVAVFMSFLDVTIVNIAFPDIRASFPGSSLSQLSWILNAYSIVFAAAPQMAEAARKTKVPRKKKRRLPKRSARRPAGTSAAAKTML